MNTGGALKQAGYSPPAGTPSGIPGASYPVLGSAPVSNMQPGYANPGAAQMRPGMAPPPLAQGGPGMQQGAMGAQGGMAAPQGGQMNPQMLAAALGRLAAR
jgi:hypothetical protein